MSTISLEEAQLIRDAALPEDEVEILKPGPLLRGSFEKPEWAEKIRKSMEIFTELGIGIGVPIRTTEEPPYHVWEMEGGP